MGRHKKESNFEQPVEIDDQEVKDSESMASIINHGPHFFREKSLIIPVNEKTEVLQEVAERLVEDFKGSPFFNFEIVEA